MLGIGLGGVCVLAFVVALMWMVVRDDDLMKAPPPVDEATQAQKLPQLGDLPKGQDKSTQKQTEDKPKQPPLNQ